MLTHLLNFFIVTKRISDWHHFCKWKFLLELCNWHFLWQLCKWQRLLHFCRFWGGTFCYLYVGWSFCYSYTVSVAIRQLEVSAANMRVTTFIVIMQMEVSVAIMKVVFSAVHYAQLFPLLWCRWLWCRWQFLVTISCSFL